MIWIKKEKNNAVVTDFYLETIGLAFERNGYKVRYEDELKAIVPEKNDLVVVSTATDVLKIYRKCKQVIFWAQGVWPEESLMRHNSKLRFKIASIIEKRALKKSIFRFFVSETMKKFFEEKYHIEFGDGYYIMPCSNEEFHRDSFEVNQKYSNNVFCYAGGTSVWQCFEQTIELYKKIEEKYSNTKLLLLVKERGIALELIEKYGVKNYEIDYVSVRELPDKLKSVKFGFVLRESSPVNYVATPTKLLTYLVNGIIPIYSTCLKGVETIWSDTKYAVSYENEEDIKQIERLMVENIVPEEILKEYEEKYNRYYARDEQVKQIKRIFAENI